jgi:hypothetical protein
MRNRMKRSRTSLRMPSFNRGRTIEISPHSSPDSSRSISPERFEPQLKTTTSEWLAAQLSKQPLKSCLSKSSTNRGHLTYYEQWLEEVELKYGKDYALAIDMDMTVNEIVALSERCREKQARLNST